MGEVTRVKNWFIIRIVASEQDPASWLGSEQHWYDRPGVSVGQRSVHLPQRVTNTMSLRNIMSHQQMHFCWSHRLLKLREFWKLSVDTYNMFLMELKLQLLNVVNKRCRMVFMVNLMWSEISDSRHDSHDHLISVISVPGLTTYDTNMIHSYSDLNCENLNGVKLKVWPKNIQLGIINKMFNKVYGARITEQTRPHFIIIYCTVLVSKLGLTFLICLPPSEPGLPDTKWNSMSGKSRLRLVNLVDTHARPCKYQTN